MIAPHSVHLPVPGGSTCKTPERHCPGGPGPPSPNAGDPGSSRGQGPRSHKLCLTHSSPHWQLEQAPANHTDPPSQCRQVGKKRGPVTFRSSSKWGEAHLLGSGSSVPQGCRRASGWSPNWRQSLPTTTTRVRQVRVMTKTPQYEGQPDGQLWAGTKGTTDWQERLLEVSTGGFLETPQ